MKDQNKKTSVKKRLGYGVLIYVGLIVGLVIVMAIAVDVAGPGDDELNDNSFSSLSSTDQSNFSASGDLIPVWAPRLGPSDAPITIVEFGDFQCPFCKASFPVIRQVMSAYPDQIQLVYRHFPLKSIHPLADELAHASMCAHEQGKFWSFHDRIFQFQDSITKDNILDNAQAIGLNLNTFNECQRSDKWEDEIQKDLAEIIQRGGRGTPSWIVNGQLIQGYLQFDTWEQIIESLQ